MISNFKNNHPLSVDIIIYSHFFDIWLKKQSYLKRGKLNGICFTFNQIQVKKTKYDDIMKLKNDWIYLIQEGVGRSISQDQKCHFSQDQNFH